MLCRTATRAPGRPHLARQIQLGLCYGARLIFTSGRLPRAFAVSTVSAAYPDITTVFGPGTRLSSCGGYGTVRLEKVSCSFAKTLLGCPSRGGDRQS
jgi:hypothetical protein